MILLFSTYKMHKTHLLGDGDLDTFFLGDRDDVRLRLCLLYRIIMMKTDDILAKIKSSKMFDFALVV